MNSKKLTLLKDAFFILDREDHIHVISENYSYKTETYYTILNKELEGHIVKPSSTDILDAYTVPICLSRLKKNNVPVCDWMISQVYTPVPALIYGINYFATTSNFLIAKNVAESKEHIKHITNNGKYPFCYQKLDEDFIIYTCLSIFGKTQMCEKVSDIAKGVYNTFKIPLVTMVIVKNNDKYQLSSLTPLKYSSLNKLDKDNLLSYMRLYE